MGNGNIYTCIYDLLSLQIYLNCVPQTKNIANNRAEPLFFSLALNWSLGWAGQGVLEEGNGIAVTIELLLEAAREGEWKQFLISMSAWLCMISIHKLSIFTWNCWGEYRIGYHNWYTTWRSEDNGIIEILLSCLKSLNDKAFSLNCFLLRYKYCIWRNLIYIERKRVKGFLCNALAEGIFILAMSLQHS